MSSPADVRDVVNVAALRAFLTKQGVQLSGELQLVAIAGGRSNLTFKVIDDTHEWVLRRPPIAGHTPSAHDVGREYRIIDALQQTSVPVARTVANCTDPDVIGAPFTIVEFVQGRVLRSRADLDHESDDDIARIHHELIRVLVDLHSIPYVDLGLQNFGRPEGFVERQIRRWREQWDLVATRELPDVDRLYSALVENVPAQQPGCVVHGDFRIDNTLLDPDSAKVLALVDWEMSTLGDPFTDLAMMCAYQHPDFDYVVGESAASTSARWPGASAIVSDYASASGRDVADFDRYAGLAFFKLAVIAEGIFARHLAGAGDGPGYSTAGLAVPGFIAAGLSALAKPW